MPTVSDNNWTRTANWFRSEFGTVRRGKVMPAGDWWWRPKGCRYSIGAFPSAEAAMRYAEDDVAMIQARRAAGGVR